MTDQYMIINIYNYELIECNSIILWISHSIDSECSINQSEQQLMSHIVNLR